MKKRMRVVVPLDGSTLAEEALDAAAAIAAGGRMSLVHAVMPTEWFAMPADVIVARERKQAARHLERLVGPLAARGIAASGTVVSGEPSAVIARHAVRERADLIVMASHGRTGAREWAFGSVAERVLRSSKIPVLVIRGRIRRPFDLRRILVPLDGSGREARLMPLVRRLAAQFTSDVVLLHVARRPAKALRRSGDGAGDRFLVREGDPAETILAVAREEGADLVALAVVPKTEGRHVMLGQVAEALLRRVELPVLVMRTGV